MRLRLLLACLGTLAVIAAPAAQSDLDQLMGRVLAERDRNWARLQQYVLEERESFRVTGGAMIGLFGFEREYSWFPSEGVFVRSPRRVDGVAISQSERQKAEEEWIRREQRRRIQEPRFVSAAYFLRFTFDPGQYALVGREKMLGRDVLKIEYYPTQLFTEGRTRPNRSLRERDEDVDDKMNKASVVTMWVEPNAHQILQYELLNVDMDFLPGRALMRMEGMRATMRMGEPFAGVWLPSTLQIWFKAAMAVGTIEAAYDTTYYDYKLAAVTTRVR